MTDFLFHQTDIPNYSEHLWQYRLAVRYICKDVKSFSTEKWTALEN